MLIRGENQPRARAKGLFIVYNNDLIPAKHALRLAYCLANQLPLDSSITFSSGEGTITRLRSLGFDVERRVAPTSA